MEAVDGVSKLADVGRALAEAERGLGTTGALEVASALSFAGTLEAPLSKTTDVVAEGVPCVIVVGEEEEGTGPPEPGASPRRAPRLASAPLEGWLPTAGPRRSSILGVASLCASLRRCNQSRQRFSRTQVRDVLGGSGWPQRRSKRAVSPGFVGGERNSVSIYI